tara:strand:+ start:80 stop:739 length:660 start_codon:yes stop_codon:yes gene_type:complete
MVQSKRKRSASAMAKMDTAELVQMLDGRDCDIAVEVLSERDDINPLSLFEIIRNNDEAEDAYRVLDSLDPATLGPCALACADMLKEESDGVRVAASAAFDVMREMDSATYDQHGPACVAKLSGMLGDDKVEVRRLALQAMGAFMKTERMLEYTELFVGKLNDESQEVREEAVKVLSLLDAATLAKHAAEIKPVAYGMLEREGIDHFACIVMDKCDDEEA